MKTFDGRGERRAGRTNKRVSVAALAAVAQALPDAVLVVDSGARSAGPTAPPSGSSASRPTRRSAANGLDFIHPDDLQLAVLALTSVQGKEVGTLLELRVRSADGWRLVEMIGAPLGDDLVLSVRDLTERRRWEVAGDEVARFRSLMQNAASVTMLLDPRRASSSRRRAGSRGMLGLDQEWLEAPAARRRSSTSRPRRARRRAARGADDRARLAHPRR